MTQEEFSVKFQEFVNAGMPASEEDKMLALADQVGNDVADFVDYVIFADDLPEAIEASGNKVPLLYDIYKQYCESKKNSIFDGVELY